MLDSTLKDGHNMKVFGLGTIASMSSLNRYEQIVTNLLAIYTAMEHELDITTTTTVTRESDHPVGILWQRHEHILRRSKKLQDDLHEIKELKQVNNSKSNSMREKSNVSCSECTNKYVTAIRNAVQNDRDNGTRRLIGHLYCRYFADLFGGQILGRPYQLALQLPSVPRHLQFDFTTIKNSSNIMTNTNE
jgi:heme oxygenase